MHADKQCTQERVAVQEKASGSFFLSADLAGQIFSSGPGSWIQTSAKTMERRWIGSTDFDQDKSITVLQWNILSQSLGENGDFALCPEEALQSGHRNSLIFEVSLFFLILTRYNLWSQELVRIKADILCLEEVDCFSHLSYVLESQGYAGIWTPKPDSPCLKFEVIEANQPPLILTFFAE